MIANLRALLAALFMAALTAVFLGVLSWPLPYLEFIPSLLAADFLIVGGILIVTALFGRIYCAVLCPLGIFQDIIFWFKKKLRKKKVHFHYSREAYRLRYGVLAILFLAWLMGLAFVPALLDPYSIYGRMAVNLLTPPWQSLVNAVAEIGSSGNYFLLEKYDLVFQGLAGLIVSAAYFLILAVLAWRYGRLYCQTICPVGTMLGTVSRFSLLQMTIDEAVCIGCGRCESHCRSACIDVAHQTIDSSRCVLCGDCISHCPSGAIHFRQRRAVVPEKTAEPAMSRRAMLTATGLAVATAAAGVARAAHDFSVMPLPSFGRGQGPIPVRPPGTGNMQQFLQQCTACQLCIDRCPNLILRPAGDEYGLAGIGRPVVDFSRGYCDSQCTICGSVCPSGAIHKLSLKVKQGTVMGIARYDIHRCLIPSEGVECGNCAIHCPVGAVTMQDMNGVKLPQVSEFKCIGCGSCEYHCPAIPKAIRVHGKK